MSGKKTVREMLLAKGFKIAEPDDPIYERLSTISVSPISAWLETPSSKQMGRQNSASETLDLTNLPFDPALAAMQGSASTQSKKK